MAKPKKDISDPIELDEPIVRGDTKVTSIQIRRPKAGELRGLSIKKLAEVDVGEVRTVLPRVSVPSITEQEIDQLDPADFMSLAMEVAGFFLTRETRASLPS